MQSLQRKSKDKLKKKKREENFLKLLELKLQSFQKPLWIDSRLKMMMKIKLWCGDLWWKTVHFTLINQILIKKEKWKRLFKESMIIYSNQDGDQLYNQEEICLHGHATNTILNLKRKENKNQLIAKTIRHFCLNLVQIMIH